MNTLRYETCTETIILVSPRAWGSGVFFLFSLIGTCITTQFVCKNFSDGNNMLWRRKEKSTSIVPDPSSTCNGELSLLESATWQLAKLLVRKAMMLGGCADLSFTPASSRKVSMLACYPGRLTEPHRMPFPRRAPPISLSLIVGESKWDAKASGTHRGRPT